MLKRALILVAAGALSLVVAVQAAPEREPNEPLESAQPLIMGQQAVIEGVLGDDGDDDVDFFAFQGRAGEVVTMYITEGTGGEQPVDTVMAIFDQEGRILRFNDDGDPDSGSPTSQDSRIENFVVPRNGRYTVGVANFPRYFMNGGAARGGFVPGDYVLIISTVWETTRQVTIEVKPETEDIVPVNHESHGEIPVAIFGAANFHVANIVVDPNALTFGPTGDEKSLVRCEQRGRDLNGDYYLDRVCHFDNQLAAFAANHAEGHLKGQMNDGTEFEARAFLKVIPAKVR